MKYTLGIIDDLVDLFFPRTCTLCGNSLFREEEILCMNCRFHLPRTGFIEDPDNPVARSFWGRLRFEHACSGYRFRKGNAVQQLVHKLKYRGQQHLGEYMGLLLGGIILSHEGYCSADLIVPVPLHPKKLKKRGYNQSACIGKGLSEATGIPMDTRSLSRTSFTKTQTKKTRYDRWENVAQVFHISSADRISGKHIILLDDVITTGATIEAAGHRLLEAGCEKLSILAFASSVH